jgi:hypothetical protein
MQKFFSFGSDEEVMVAIKISHYRLMPLFYQAYVSDKLSHKTSFVARFAC